MLRKVISDQRQPITYAVSNSTESQSMENIENVGDNQETEENQAKLQIIDVSSIQNEKDQDILLEFKEWEKAQD